VVLRDRRGLVNTGSLRVKLFVDKTDVLKNTRSNSDASNALVGQQFEVWRQAIQDESKDHVLYLVSQLQKA
jgi:hypothetical protein